MKVFESVPALLDAVGTELGTSAWRTVDQAQVNLFADATGDHQWIHVDPERAAAGPFGGTIAHGFLTLSLLPAFMAELFDVQRAAMKINYGLDKVRFLQPVRVGSKLRANGVVTSAEQTGTGIRVGTRITVEIDGEAKPALIADSISLFVAEP
jgi:acyl dehydratase